MAQSNKQASNTKAKPFIVALTGGIASGKTAASDAFAALGVPVVDTDVIARQVVAPDSAGLTQVVEAFGQDILASDGGLDRAALRTLIFSDAAARLRLEGILHPLIVHQTEQQLQAIQAPYVILVVPLLVESGLFKQADRVLVVDVPEQLQIERLMARDGSSLDAAKRALSAQASRKQRLQQADDVLENNASLAQLQSGVASLHQQYLRLAGKN